MKQFFINSQFRLNSALSLACCLFSFFCVAGYLQFGPTHTSNSITALLGVALGLMMAAAIRFSPNERVGAVLALLAILLLIFFMPRHFQYLTSRQDSLRMLYIAFPMEWSPSDINKGLSFFLLGTASIIVGLFSGDRVFRYLSIPHNQILPHEFSRASPKLTAVFLAGLIVFLVDGYFTIYLGQSASANCIDPNIKYTWLIHFFSGDIFIFVLMAIFLPRFYSLTFSGKLFLIAFILFYYGYTLILGSRGGAIRIFFIALCIWLSLYGAKLAFSIRQLLPVVVMVSALSSFSFVAGSNIRDWKTASCGEKENVFGISLNNGSGQETRLPLAKISEPSQKWVERYVSYPYGSGITYPQFVNNALDRIATLDYAVGFVAMQPDEELKMRYLSWDYVSKVVINNLLPGVYFADAQIGTNSLIPVIYRGYSMAHVKQNFLSENYTIWGVAFVYFGWAGGLFFLFITAALLQLTYSYLIVMRPPVFCCEQALRGGVYLWIVAMGAYFISFGIDHAIGLVMYTVLQLATTLALIVGFERLISGFSSKKQPAR